MYSHILIATDGSDLAAKAVNHGIELAKALKAKATVLTVTAPARAFVAEGVVVVPTQEIKEASERHTKAVLAAAGERAKASGVTMEAVAVENDQPWRAIIDTARAKGADLIVMASHGRRGLSAVLLGSETQKVLTHSAIPILVYR
jgi:nucleotide-binding universal stress UspA family protein